jgi:3'-phosphoadenosine 5'-phosphosulfate sulfotransferase (PAPS reductase)/FAD synthetase
MREEYVLSLSYGKDSLACLGAIKKLGLPLDRIVHSEVWATETIPAELPEMVEFKKKADKIIMEIYGIEVEHIRSESTAEQEFYKLRKRGNRKGQIIGFPMVTGCEFQKPLKVNPLQKATKNAIVYVGIAFDETHRFGILKGNKRSPLVDAEWTEEMCRKWCEENNLLSPAYTITTRGGCWFCPNNNLNNMRNIRKNYPNLWDILLKWDIDSPVSFKPDGHTVHDFDKRFEAEEKGIVPTDRTFRWNMLDHLTEKGGAGNG